MDFKEVRNNVINKVSEKSPETLVGIGLAGMLTSTVLAVKATPKALDILADFAVLVLAVIMMTQGWTYAISIGSKGTYVSMTWLSRFWMYFPICLAGVAMIVFEIEAIQESVKSFRNAVFTRLRDDKDWTECKPENIRVKKELL